ncbi:MAG TPA: carboxypeptidase regulatory-like domain-containing protein, partial [Blastocatellia bacterium]|nr:carboxypeptidase regulatory-like domain-containing protein [Blastocatellia bacterium]
MKSRIPSILLTCLLMMTAAATALAQFDTAVVLGTVHDPNGAAISKATVTLKNIATGITATAQTDEDGNYQFFNVKIGAYQVAAEAQGFARAVADNIQVTVNARQRIDLALKAGAVTETVMITDVAPLLETESSDRGQVINRQQIVNLPLNGRSYADLALLAPGVRRSILAAQESGARDASFNVNGLRSALNNFALDGVDNNFYGTSNQGFSNQVMQPSPDALQEFKVQTNNFSAEFGRYGGAVINATIKSGTNDLHGSMFEFLRNDALDANNFFNNRAGRSLPAFRQNQFGGTAGGPLVRNKLFLFGSYQGTRIAQGVTNLSTVPTQNERNGIFSAPVFDPATTRANPGGAGSIRDAFPGNQIPSSRFDPTGKKIVDIYPAPNLSGPNNFILNPGN